MKVQSHCSVYKPVSREENSIFYIEMYATLRSRNFQRIPADLQFAEGGSREFPERR